MARTPPPTGGVNTAPPVSAEKPSPQAWLPAHARVIFAELVERLDSAGGASKTHEEALNLCAMSLAQVSALTQVLAEKGTTYETVSTNLGVQIKARPEYAQCSEAARRATQLLIELGLTPAARKKVKAGPKSGAAAAGAFGDL